MNLNLLLEPNALAALQLRAGTIQPVAVCKNILSQYSYVESIDDPQRFDMMSENPQDVGAALVFNDDFENVIVFGDESTDNVLNLNYILLKMGWVEGDAVVHSNEASELIIGQLSNVATECTVLGNKGNNTPHLCADLQPDAEEIRVFGTSSGDIVDAEIAAGHVTSCDEPSPNLLDEIQNNYRELTGTSIKLDDMEMQLAEAEAAHAQTKVELKEAKELISMLKKPLRPALANRSISNNALSTDGDNQIIGILEDHLSSLVELTDTAESALLKKLKANGYKVKVRLVKEAIVG